MYLDAVGQPPEKGENVVADLLDRHAGIYSDSPHNIVAYKIFTASVLVAFTCYAYYGDVSVEAYHGFHPIRSYLSEDPNCWRSTRKAAHEDLRTAHF